MSNYYLLQLTNYYYYVQFSHCLLMIINRSNNTNQPYCLNNTKDAEAIESVNVLRLQIFVDDVHISCQSYSLFGDGLHFSWRDTNCTASPDS